MGEGVRKTNAEIVLQANLHLIREAQRVDFAPLDTIKKNPRQTVAKCVLKV